MTAVRASLAGFPCAGELLVLGLHARIETGRDEGGHGDLADALSTAADGGATGPAARLSRHGRKACETCGLPRFKGAELGHFDEQGEGGDGRAASNAGQDCEPLGETRIGLNLREDLRLDRRDMAFDPFEGDCARFNIGAVRILPRLLAAARPFTRASRAR
jgi:hypothetical protein